MLVRLGLAVTCSVAAVTFQRQLSRKSRHLGNEGSLILVLSAYSGHASDALRARTARVAVLGNVLLHL